MTVLATVLAIVLPAGGTLLEHDHDQARAREQQAIAIAHARARRDPRRRIVRPYRAKLARMAYCESTNRPWAVDPSGTYFGLYQFDVRTWFSVGGRGMPHQASRLEQSFRAVLLIRRRGYTPWPVCGYR